MDMDAAPSGGPPGETPLSRLILESTLDAVIVMDVRGMVRAWNSRAEAVFGWSEAEALGRHMADLIIPERYREAHNRGLSRFMATGAGPILGRRVEMRGLRRDGEEFPVELTVTAARTGSTAARAGGDADPAQDWNFIGFLRDQTEEKRAHGRLQVQNALYRLLAESPSLDAIEATLLATITELDPWLFGSCWHRDGDSLRCSALKERPGHAFPAFRALTRDLGLRLGEGLPGRAWETKAPLWVADASLDPGPLPRGEAARKEGLRAAFVLPVLVRGETALVFEFYSRSPRGPDAELIDFASTLGGQLGIYLERTAADEERKALLGKLEEERTRLSALLDFTPTPIVLMDPGTALLGFANKAAHRLAGGVFPTGVTYAEFPQDFYAADKSGRRLDPEEAPSTRAARGETLVDLEVVWHVGGAKRNILINSSTLKGGNPETIVIAFQDITHLKQVEEQLRQSQKMEAIGQLAGGIAHDFNNLLTAINGYSSMALEMLPASDPLHDYMSEVLRSGERAAGLTRQLLAYSRKQVLEAKVWDLNVIVGDMQAMLRRLIGEDVLLATDLAPGPITAKVDRGQVEQILLNLSLNSRDAMPLGGKLILETRRVFLDAGYCAVHPEAQPGPHAVLSVGDTGLGMTPEVKARAFEPFFTTKEVGKGTGLGLSSVYGIVKQSGGFISLYSEPGHGTSFRIYFPEARGGPRTEAETGTPSSYHGSETVLLVEDEEAVRRFAAQALEVQGYTVRKAANGREAMEALEREHAAFSLVITDVVMPDIGGQVLAEHLRERYPELPVLFISGYTEASVIHRGLVDRQASFLQKPFGPSDLARAVREALDRGRPPQRMTEKKASE